MRQNTGLGRALPLVAALLLAAPPRPSASPYVGTLTMSKCRGAAPVTEDNPTIYTTFPDAWNITIGSTTANLACPATLATPQLISNTQALWPLNNALTDSAANGNTLTASYGWNAGAGCDVSCAWNTCKYPAFNPTGKFGQARDYLTAAATPCNDSAGAPVAGKSWYSFAKDQVTSTPLQNTFQGGSWSVEAWVKDPGPLPDRTGGTEAPILIEGSVDMAGNGCNDNKCVFLGFVNKYLYMGFGNHSTTGKTQAGAGWHHVAFVYNRSSNAQYVYMDGQLDNNASSPSGSAKGSPLAATGLSSTFLIGGGVSLWVPTSLNSNDGNAFGGTIDELRIVNYALSPQEVAAHWTGQGYARSGTYIGGGTCGASYTFNQANLSLSGQTSGTLGFFAEDTTESVGYKDITLTIDQTNLLAPVLDSSNVTTISNNSITWSWGSDYACNSPQTTYKTQLIDNGTAGTWSVSQAASSLSASPLSPNRCYGLSVKATYIDTGGSGQIIGPSPASLATYATTYANTPGTPSGAFTSGTALTLTISANSNPDGSGGTNATEYLVQSSRNGGTYSTVSSWSTSLTRSLSLLKSSRYAFEVMARNVNNVESPLSPASTLLYTQPNTPTGLLGSPATGGGYCPKTDILWSWNTVTRGSDGAAAQYRLYGENAGWTTGSQNPASYVKTGLTPGTPYGAYVQAYDSGATSTGGRDNSLSDTSATYYATTYPYGTSAPSELTGTSLAGGVSWSWTPPVLCSGGEYQVINAVSGAVLATSLAAASYPPWTQTLGANVKSIARVQARDTIAVTQYGAAYWSPLSNSATTYSLANVPASLALTSISTGGAVVSWSDNGNASYTRYEFTYSPDNFLATTSTRLAVTDNFTGAGTLATNLTGLAAGTTYYLRVRAFNGRDSEPWGGLATGFLTGVFVTRPAAPVLTGTALSQTSVRWDWTHPSGASGYNLYDTPTLALLASGAVVTYTSATLSVNTRYDAEVEAYVPEPAYADPQPIAVGRRGGAHVYTLANDPVSPIVSAMYVSSGVFSWGTNGNPSYTNYELSIATHSNFKVVVATIGASGATATVTDLLPATSYYARVRAFNGDQIPAPLNAFLVFAATMTAPDPGITVSSAPPSPYVLPSGLEGVWQFDEGSGLASADGSASANTVQFTCTAALCASTPTFASGPAAFGTAASFSGLEYGVARTQNNFTAFNGDLTVSAWVYPQSASQRDYAGLVAVGNKDSEDFALDIVSGRFRFLANSVPTVKAAWAPSSIAPGVWTHVVGVYDSAAAAATLYLNGVAAAAVTGVPARSNSGQRLSIGNRLSAAGAYTLPFLGRMDSVRVLRRALNAAEVLSDYQGGFVSTVTPSAPNSAVLVGLPPNAFTSPVRIFISADPASHPIKIPHATLNAGLASLPSGMTLVPNSVVEVVPVVDGMPFTAALGSSATVSIPYTDADGNNLVDGSVLPASGIRMYTLNTTVNRWDALSTSVDPAGRRATGLTPHFSVFALFAPSTVGSGLSGVRVYPVPWKPGSGGRFDAGGLTFDNLPASGRIHILTLAGEGVADLRFDGQAAGLVTWDGRTKHGRRAASGVYFAKIVSDAGGSMLVKFAIER